LAIPARRLPFRVSTYRKISIEYAEDTLMKSYNPATGELLEEHRQDTPEDVERKLEHADQAYAHWRQTDFPDRRKLMRRAAELLRDREDSYAELMTHEMGKPIGQARSEITKCAWVCEYFADNAEDFLADEPMTSDGSDAYVRFDPIGPVLAIMPWNFPFWQVFRFAAPNLMAGNVGLLKHSENTLGCSKAISAIFDDAGFPTGAFDSLYVGHEAVESVIADDRIRAVTLTGSTRAGRAVAAQAGRAIKKTVLELGGSDPFIVLHDCDFAHTLDNAVVARTQNNGQSCIAAKRFLVEDGIYDRFVEEFSLRLESLVVGDPEDEEVDIGPLAREDLRDGLHDQVTRSIEAGAHLELGGEPLDGPGWFYKPTLLTGVEPGMAAFDEETFGPVAAVTRVEDLDHAIRLANDSAFGLGASVWTDSDRGEEAAARIEAGHVAVNGIVKSDPRLPFGGVKTSGYGRELSVHGIREFVNRKTVWVA
jgi:succinate-semialdehyde dehydrogenase/glutarate-semialdehyde dehydrogenase